MDIKVLSVLGKVLGSLDESPYFLDEKIHDSYVCLCVLVYSSCVTSMDNDLGKAAGPVVFTQGLSVGDDIDVPVSSVTRQKTRTNGDN